MLINKFAPLIVEQTFFLNDRTDSIRMHTVYHVKAYIFHLQTD